MPLTQRSTSLTCSFGSIRIPPYESTSGYRRIGPAPPESRPADSDTGPPIVIFGSATTKSRAITTSSLGRIHKFESRCAEHEIAIDLLGVVEVVGIDRGERKDRRPLERE